jgi:hypothetical protein
MIHPTVFTGDQSPLSITRPTDDLGPITDAGIGNQGLVRAIARTNDLALIVMQCHTGLDVVSRKPNAPIADALIESDATARR